MRLRSLGHRFTWLEVYRIVGVPSDAIGSTIGLTDGLGGVATTFGYDLYGTSSTGGAANENAQRFTGREDDLTGLIFFRTRYYLPPCGRFISEDSAGFYAGPYSLLLRPLPPRCVRTRYGRTDWGAARLNICLDTQIN